LQEAEKLEQYDNSSKNIYEAKKDDESIKIQNENQRNMLNSKREEIDNIRSLFDSQIRLYGLH
jgi:hypothetical protein